MPEEEIDDTIFEKVDWAPDSDLPKIDIDMEELDALAKEDEQDMGEEEESGDALPNLEHPGGEAHSPERPAAQPLRGEIEPAVAANAPRSPGTRRKSSQPRGNDPTRIRTAPDDRRC